MKPEIKTFIFYDCETTGLDRKAKITELALTAILREHILQTGTNKPRILNKLTLCLNPRKQIHYEASNLTGLYNDMLQYHAEFTADTVNLLNLFIKHLPPPACLVAHNGNAFDFPILKRLVEQCNIALNPALLTVDTLQIWREKYLEEAKEQIEKAQKIKGAENNVTDPQAAVPVTPSKSDCIAISPVKRPTKRKLQFGQSPSFKLGDVYQRLTGSAFHDSHEAESDVAMLMRCCILQQNDFVARADRSATLFSELQE